MDPKLHGSQAVCRTLMEAAVLEAPHLVHSTMVKRVEGSFRRTVAADLHMSQVTYSLMYLSPLKFDESFLRLFPISFKQGYNDLYEYLLPGIVNRLTSDFRYPLIGPDRRMQLLDITRLLQPVKRSKRSNKGSKASQNIKFQVFEGLGEVCPEESDDEYTLCGRTSLYPWFGVHKHLLAR